MILASWLENLRSTRFWGIGSRRTPRSIRHRFRRWNDWNPNPIDAVQKLEDRTMLTIPTGVDDSYFFEQDTADVSMDVLDNDIDPDAMGLTISSVGTPLHGTATIQPGGGPPPAPPGGNDVLVYNANIGYSGTDTFDYTLQNAFSETDTATVNVTIHQSDDLIVDARTTSLVANVKKEFQGSIGDGDQGDKDVEIFKVTLAAGQQIIADIDADELDNGVSLSNLDSFLRIFDATGTELASNDDANDPDTGVPHLDSAITFTAPSSGDYYVGISGNGNELYDPNSLGTGVVGSLGEYVLQLTLLGNSDPVAVDDSFTLEEDSGQVTLEVLANDSDPDGNPITIDSTTTPTSGTATIDSVADPNTILYQPNAGITGIDSFDYTLDDGFGGSATATVTANVHASDDTLTSSRTVTLTLDVEQELEGIVGDGAQGSNDVDLFQITLNAGEEIVADIDARDLDDGSSLGNLDSFLRLFDAAGVELVTNDTGTDPDSNTTGIDAVLYFTATATGTYYLGVSGTSNQLYNPNTAGSGVGTDSGRYRLQLLKQVNDPPVTTDDLYYVEADSGNVTLDVLANDSDPQGSVLTIASKTDPTNGTVTIAGDNTLTYAPNTSFTGSDSLSYNAADPSGLETTGSVTLTVHAADDTLANARSVSLVAGIEQELGGIVGDGLQGTLDVDLFSLTLAVNDILRVDIDAQQLDDGSSFSNLDGYLRLFDASGTQVAFNNDATDPDTGSFSQDSAITFFVSTAGTYYIGVSGNLNSTYDPTIAGSGAAGSSGHYRLQLQVDPNSAPDAVDDIIVTNVSTPVTFGVMGNDSDPDGDPLSFVSNTQPMNGSLFVTMNNGIPSYDYTPNPGFTGIDSFQYTIQDSHGLQATAEVKLNVGNTAPVAFADAYEAVAGQQFDVTAANGVLANDTDPENDPLQTILVSDVQNGTLTLAADGSFSYTATAGYRGSDSFTYKATDTGLESNTVTVTFDVYPEETYSDDDSFSTVHDTPLNVAAPGLLTNDWDFQGDPLTAELVSGPTNGILTLNTDGSFDYTPNAFFAGNESFTYRVTDGINFSSASTVTINVTNLAPHTTNDYLSVAHDTVLTLTTYGVLSNDGDWELDPLTAQLETGPANGLLTLNADGTLTYAPNAGFVGTDTFSYRADDGIFSGNLATVTIEVTNNAPIVGNNAFVMGPNVVLNVIGTDLLDNDWDPEGDAVTAVLETTTTSGVLVFNANGTFTYTPNTNFTGSDSFTYHLNDGLTDSPTATVSISVENDTPAAVVDFYRVAHDQSLIVVLADGVLVNDYDSEGDAVTATLVTSPTNGTLTFNADGTFTYTPTAGFVGTDTFTYTSSDAFGQSTAATVTLEVTNDIPTARGDLYSVHQGTSLSTTLADGLLINDGDAETDPLTASVVTLPASGTLTLNADGTFVYTPNAGFTGTDSFTYKVNDGLADSDPIAVDLSVTNTDPVAVGESYSVLHDSALNVVTGGVLDNDSDVDADGLTAMLANNVANGTLTFNSDGTFNYTPNAGFAGTDSFTYTVSDGVGSTLAVTASIAVTNNLPAANDRSYSTLHSTMVSVDALDGLLLFASDGDSDSLTAQLVNPTTPVANGTLAFNSDGTFAYTPNAGFVGTDSFQFTVSDGVGQSLVLTASIEVTNALPSASDNYYVVSHDRILNVTTTNGVLVNDSDFDSDPLSVSLVSGEGVSHGTLTLNADGTFAYTPTAGYIGTDSFTYELSDGAETVQAVVTLEVVNAAPLSNEDRLGVLAGQSLVLTAATGVLANDIDTDTDTMTVTLVDNVANGTLTLNSDGSLTYTPNAGFTGVDSFTYTAADGFVDPETQLPVVGNKARARIEVYSQVLVTETESFELFHDRPLSGDVIANDFNWNQVAVTATLVSGPTNGVLTLNADGTFDYTPNAGFTGQDSFSYLLDDGTTQSNASTVTIDVSNTAPSVLNTTYEAAHGQTLSVDNLDGVMSTSYDVEADTLTASVVAGPTNGTLILNTDGSFDYTPTVSTFVGTDSFTFKLNDGLLDGPTVTVTLEVTNTNPYVLDDSYDVHAGTSLVTTILDSVLVNDRDDEGDTLTAALVTNVTNGTLLLNADGTFTYTPNTGFLNGIDSFTYTLNDGVGDSLPATVTITVGNSTPATLSDSFSLLHDSALTTTALSGVLANDLDWDGDTVTATVSVAPTNGTLTLNADGSFVYTPNAGFAGTDSFTYIASDGLEQSLPVTVDFTVVNNAPQSLDDSFFTRRNEAVTIVVSDIVANDSDSDNDAIAFTQLTTVTNGTLVDNLDGTLTYTPNAGYVGTETFTYEVSDGLTSGAIATVSIEVANAVPTAANDSYRIVHDQTLNAVSGELLLNDFDLNTDALSVSLASGTTNGTLILNADGSFDYTPNAGFLGKDSFQYTVSDGVDSSETATVTLEVYNSRPFARLDAIRVNHDTQISVDVLSGLLGTARDSEDDPLSVTLMSDVSNGTLTINADGSYSYTPTAGFVGTDGFTFQVDDGLDSSETATVRIDVTNTPASAVTDLYTAQAGVPLVVNAPGVLENDFDFEGDTLTLSLVETTGRGTLVWNGDGAFTYTPAAGAAGPDSFIYKISDGVNESYGTVYLNTIGNDTTGETVPRVGNDIFQMTHSTTLNVSGAGGLLSNDFDPNGDSLTVTLVSGPSFGTLVLNADGSFDYTPDPGDPAQQIPPKTGTDSFTYKVSDGTNESANATVTFKIDNVLPWASNTAYGVHQGDTLDITVVGLAAVAADNDGNDLTFEQMDPSGVLEPRIYGPFNGSVTFNSDGTFSYTPDAGFVGTDSFSFRVNDKVGDSNIATVTIDVTNFVPTVLDTDYRVKHGQTLTVEGVGVLSTAVDNDGDLTTASLITGPTDGTLTLNGDGSFVYTPNSTFSGTDSFVFVANDGAENSLPVTVSIDVENSSPEAFDASRSVHHDNPLAITPNVWDPDGDALTIEIADADMPLNGTLTYSNLIDAGAGSSPVVFSGSITYTPNAGFVGTDTVTITASDGVASSLPAILTFDVTNLAPIAADGIAVGTAGENLVTAEPGLFRYSGDGDGDELTITIVAQPANGTLTLATNAQGKQTGGYTYSPNAGFAGTESFTYKVSDGAEESAVTTMTIEVTNNAPFVANPRVRLHQNGGSGSYSFNLSDEKYSSIDPDGHAITYSKLSDPLNGTLNLNADGSAVFMPTDPLFLGTQTFTFVANDGYVDSAVGTVTIDISNIAPEAVDDHFRVAHDGTLAISLQDLIGNDFDFDFDELELVNVSSPTSGTLTYIATTGGYTYASNGTAGTASFTYQVTDGVETSAVATVEIEVTNAPVWGLDRSFALASSTSINFTLIGLNDPVWSPDSDAISLTITTPVANGTLTAESDGSYTYQPTNYFVGTDSFQFTLTDGVMTSDPITVDFDVQVRLGFSVDDGATGSFSFGKPDLPLGPVNYTTDTFVYNEPSVPLIQRVPLGVPDGHYHVLHGRTYDSVADLGRSLLSNDYDADGDTLTVTAYQGAGFVVNPNGHFTYDASNTPSVYTVQYKISDGTTTSDWIDVTIKVTNTKPLGGNEYYGVFAPNLSGSGTIVASGTLGDDPDDDVVVVTTSQPANGTLDLFPPGSKGEVGWTYIPDLNFRGVDSFTYTVTDDASPPKTNSGTIYIAMSDDPDFLWNMVEAGDDEWEWVAGTLSSTTAPNDFSLDFFALTFTSAASGTNGFTLNSDGSFTFTPISVGAFIAGGALSFAYTATDTNGASDSATITISPYILTVGATKDDPTLSGATASNGIDGVGEPILYFESGTAYLQKYDGTYYAFGASGAAAAGTPDVVWSGDVVGLSLGGGGDVEIATSPINGDVNLNIIGTVGDVKANTLRVEVTEGTGELETIAGPVYYAVSDNGSIKSITSFNDVFGVRAASLGFIDGQGVAQGISAQGNIGYVWVEQNIAGKIIAQGSIGYVGAGNDVQKSVNAVGGNIGFIAYDLCNTPVMGPSCASISDDPNAELNLTGNIGGVYAGQDVLDIVLAGSGAISYVYAIRNIEGNITSVGSTAASIYHVQAKMGDVNGQVNAAGSVGKVVAGTNINGNIDGQNVGLVHSGAIIAGTVTATTHIGGVFAGTDLTGSVTASGGNIATVEAAFTIESDDSRTGNINNGTISANDNIGGVKNHADIGNGGDIISGNITATTGFIGDITAPGQISGTIKAGTSIADVLAQYNISGSIETELITGTFIQSVTSTAGSIFSMIEAGSNVGPVYANQSITGNITAGKSLYGVEAEFLEINGIILADNTVGNISAGTDIAQTITATNGHIGEVNAGNNASSGEGNILGDITAKKNIAFVGTNVIDPDAYDLPDLTDFADILAQLNEMLQDQNLDLDNLPTVPDLPEPPSVDGGNILGKIKADGSIGKVLAVGEILNDVTALQSIDAVFALGNINSNISSQTGSLLAATWGEFQGTVNANGDVRSGSYETFSADVTSTTGIAYVNSWDSLLSKNISGPLGAEVFAYGSIGTGGSGAALMQGGGSGAPLVISSGNGHVGAFTFGDANATLDGAKVTGLGALGNFNGKVISRNSGTFVSALRGINGKIQAAKNAVLSSLAQIRGSINAGEDGRVTGMSDFTGKDITRDIHVSVQRYADGDYISHTGSIYVEAGHFVGSAIAKQGEVGLDIYGINENNTGAISGDVNGATIEGGKGVSIRARGSILDSKGIHSANGPVAIFADGSVSGKIHAEGQGVAQGIGDVTVVAWQDSTSSFESKHGSVQVFVRGNISGEVKAGTSAGIIAWGTIDKSITAGTTAFVFARNDINGEVTAGHSATVISAGNITKNVTAGFGDGFEDYDATVIAIGAITGDVTADRNAIVDAFGNISGDVTAHKGTATVSSLGNYTGTINAKGNIHVTLGGNFASATAKSQVGVLVSVSTHGSISAAHIEGKNQVDVLSDKSITNATVYAGKESTGSAILSALDDIVSSTVEVGANAMIFAGKTADVNAKAKNGQIDVVALGALQGTYTAKTEVNVTAFGIISSFIATADIVSVFAEGALDGTLTAKKGLSASALMSVNGIYTSFGGATIFAADHFDGTATATNNITVSAGKTLSGTVKSEKKDANAYSIGEPGSYGNSGISATVTAALNAHVVSLGGDVSGTVTATAGNAKVGSASGITQSITAGGNATVWAMGSLSAPGTGVTAGGVADVFAFGNINTGITSTGSHAYVTAGINVSKNVTAFQNAGVRARTGSISGNVTSLAGYAIAVAAAGIDNPISAYLDATAITLGSVNGSVTSTTTHAFAAALGGSVNGAVTAPLDAGAVALNSVTSTISAGRDAFVYTLGDQLGTVTGGRDAFVIAAGSSLAPVTANRNAGIIAFESIQADVTATTGSASVISWGPIATNLTAGDSAYAITFGAGGATVNATAPNDTLVVSMGVADVGLNAGKDAVVWSAGMQVGGLIAGQDAISISMGLSQVNIDATRDAFLFTFLGHTGDITAGQDAFVFSLGTTTGTVVTAGRDAGVFSLDSAITVQIDAGRYASLISWDMALGPIIVDGDEGVFAWSYSNMNGQVTSLNGPVVAISLGTAFHMIVDAGTDALVATVGDFDGSVTAGGFAVTITLGNFLFGSVTAGGDIVQLGEGYINSITQAGKDLFVYAYGDVRGYYHANRDASVTSYGNFDAGLFADRDIGFDSFSGSALPGLAVSGSINGMISAGRNIQNDIVSQGTINATIFAYNTAGSPEGGQIGNIAAWGEIAGLIVAESSIGNIRSGAAVTATLSAPAIGTVTEFDANVVTDFPMPTVPASVKGEILAEAAAFRAELDTEKQALADVFAQFAADMEVIRLEAADDIAEARSETEAKVALAKKTASDRLKADRKAAQDVIERGQQAAAASIARLKTQIAKVRKALETEVARVRKLQDQGFQRATALAAEANRRVEAYDAKLEKQYQDLLKQSEKERVAFSIRMKGLFEKQIKESFSLLKESTSWLWSIWVGQAGDWLDTGMEALIALSRGTLNFFSLGYFGKFQDKFGPKTLKYNKTIAKYTEIVADTVAIVTGVGAAAKYGVKYLLKKAVKKSVDDLTKAGKSTLKGAANKADDAVKKINKTNNPAGTRSLHEKYKTILRRNMSQPHVTNPKLKNHLDDLWRPDAKFGSGSTADAARAELAFPGTSVGGANHVKKAKDSVVFLEKWLKNNQNASARDIAGAENTLKDLIDALSTNPIL